MENKNVGICVLLSIITCGIYGLYWFVCITDDVNTLSKNENNTSGMMSLLFSIITCGIYSIYWAYKMGNEIDMIKYSKNIHSSNSGIIYLLLTIFGLSIIVFAIMQNEINNLSSQNTDSNKEYIEIKNNEKTEKETREK